MNQDYLDRAERMLTEVDAAGREAFSADQRSGYRYRDSVQARADARVQSLTTALALHDAELLEAEAMFIDDTIATYQYCKDAIEHLRDRAATIRRDNGLQ